VLFLFRLCYCTLDCDMHLDYVIVCLIYEMLLYVSLCAMLGLCFMCYFWVCYVWVMFVTCFAFVMV